jgi:adenylate kinase
MKLALLGAPGAGKGTLATAICKYFEIPHISTGDMLRAGAKSSTGLEAAMASGGLVDDDLIMRLVGDRVATDECRDGFLLDGIPRTLAQAQGLSASGVRLDYVLEIRIDSELIVERMSGRRTHLVSGRTYHVTLNPPKVAGKDDVTGEPLVQRPDDVEAIVRRRLDVYQAQTRPLVDYYRALDDDGAGTRFVSIDGSGAVVDVAARALRALSR